VISNEIDPFELCGCVDLRWRVEEIASQRSLYDGDIVLWIQRSQSGGEGLACYSRRGGGPVHEDVRCGLTRFTQAPGLGMTQLSIRTVFRDERFLEPSLNIMLFQGGKTP
jgi:hypothetical protein